MAGYRQIHTKIWTDAWFMELPADHKLLYVYLFSNERTSVCGLYELPLKVIAFETGFDIELVRTILDNFRDANKVEYDYDFSVIWVKNMAKYQTSSSPKLQTRIQLDIKAVPECTLKDRFNMVSIGYGYGKDTSISSPSLVNLNLESSTIPDESEGQSAPDPFFSMIQRLTGLTVGGNDIKVMMTWEKDGVIEADICDALQWRKDNNLPGVKYISQLTGSINTARLNRIQGSNAKPGGNGKASQPKTTPIIASDYEPKVKK